MTPKHNSFRPELFENICTKFLKHISQSNNDRILFSGKFGIGKSYFLNHFFKPETQEEKLRMVKYRPLHISPVNYSISNNDDIFLYIKYDIINSILLNGIDLEESDFKKTDAFPVYLKRNWKKVLETIVSMMPKIGKSISENYRKIEELYRDFSNFSKDLVTSEGDKLVAFLEEIEQKEGSLFESGQITNIICSILTGLKAKSSQENILIIDDLDRCDPAHVFRILNVFAAHLDNGLDLSNKFGFDKVILVCDINNLRSIFRSRYGVHTDFNGYIDKFYSHDIFHFDNRKELITIAWEAFKSVNFVNTDHPRASMFYESKLFQNNSLPLELLEIFIRYNLVNLRNLLVKIASKIEVDPSKHLYFDDLSGVRQIDVLLLAHFSILKDIMGGYDVIKEYVGRVPSSGFHLPRINQYCNQLLYFVQYRQTFRAQDKAAVIFNGKEYYLKVPQDMSGELSTLILFNLGLGEENNPIQVNFSEKDFQLLLSDFLDLLIRIENTPKG